MRADPMGLRRQAARRERDQRASVSTVVEPVVRDLIAVGGSRHGRVDLGHDCLGPLQAAAGTKCTHAEAAAGRRDPA